MARPIRNGLEYFPHDVNLDEKFDYIEAVHGVVGYAVVWKLYERIYRSGYFIPWTDKELTLFTSKLKGVAREEVESIVSDCLNEGIFHKGMFDTHKILTSAGIQKRYLHVSNRRKERIIVEEYLLVQIPQPDEVVVRTNGELNEVSVRNNSINDVLRVRENGERKEKESTPQESTAKESTDYASPARPPSAGKAGMDLHNSEQQRTSAESEQALREKEFVLRLDESEFELFESRIFKIIAEENSYRNGNAFVWKPLTGSFRNDLKGLIYKLSDATKKRLLLDAYNILGEKMNWPNYVEKGILAAIRASAKKPIHEPYKFVLYLLKSPQAIISESVDGSLASVKFEVRRGK